MSLQTSTSPQKVKSVTLKILKEIPKTVKVGNITVKIIHNVAEMAKANIKHGNGDEKAGFMLEGEQQILIDPTLGPDIKADTLLHEVMHWIFYLSGGREFFSHKKEEQVISLLASGLHDTLKRNPELVAYLLGEENEMS